MAVLHSCEFGQEILPVLKIPEVSLIVEFFLLVLQELQYLLVPKYKRQ